MPAHIALRTLVTTPSADFAISETYCLHLRAAPSCGLLSRTANPLSPA